ncbi:ATP-dependent nuclease [Mesorhizobium japonicum]|uniref:Mlr8165 protein n=1 Tax=Mesorhizobium japonicum (strain LMG 29417 / CECT 9101 / MAFF 303099) TaxID=266835 RepID=Q983V1_RHILO|nr:ATP-dependent endonuclease [Mesorhizobium japonicum]BAB53779.1 mlr8165 [Mesorhizobium japonicum MAFF 303099]
MHISKITIRNFRSFAHLDVRIAENTTCIIGENNTGKTNLLQALRLCLDVNLASSYRSLLPSDIHSAVDLSHPSQVVIAIEIDQWAGKVNEEALVGGWQVAPDRARLIYRFRPKLKVRDDLADETIEPGDLTIDDYQWEITGGGDPRHDVATVDWDQDIGVGIRFSDLQSFLVVHLPALRDVESDLRQTRSSPLTRLIAASEIDHAEKDALVQALRDANQTIAESPTIEALAEAIDASFTKVSGPAFDMGVGLGLAEPSFQAIVKALRILLTNAAVTDFDPAQNGLGLNNILYVSIWIEYFNKRLAQEKSAGQIILFEEPEAHLHPQLQLALFGALKALPFQSILTTHSTHITSQADLSSFVVLTNVGVAGTASGVPAENKDLEQNDIADLERFLDATKSNMLFARKVILVEGPAELFLIPPLVKEVMEIDLDREGIAVIPIYGVHFDVYAKLFTEGSLPKRCAIVADGDLKPSDAIEEDGDDELPDPPDLDALENDYVKVFRCPTTFERAITISGTLEMFAKAADEIGAPRVATRLRRGVRALEQEGLTADQRRELLDPLRAAVLSTAKRFGKARFAQLASSYVSDATALPPYIKNAVKWLRDDEADE